MTLEKQCFKTSQNKLVKIRQIFFSDEIENKFSSNIERIKSMNAMEAQIYSQSVLFSLMPARHAACQTLILVQSSPVSNPVLRWAFSREETVHFFTCLLVVQAQSRPSDPTLEIITLFSHPCSLNEQRFAKCNNLLMPNALKFFSHFKPTA